jgi:transposase InsO family protein
VIHYSDRKIQCSSHAFQARLKEYGMVCSISQEGFFGYIEQGRSTLELRYTSRPSPL